MAQSKPQPRSTRFRIKLPATSANLGPAFDAAALAFRLFLKIEARQADRFSITARGRDPHICGQLENHLILNTYRELLEAHKQRVAPLAVIIDNDIPIGKGCGSSAAARLAGIALANHFGHLRWNDPQIVAEASRLEHHPDNAAACWMGGLAIARIVNDQAVVARVLPKVKWPLLVAVPPESLSTEEARRVLPANYSRADAVSNVQNSMLLLAGFTQGRKKLLETALDDKIHEPYRARLCPLLPALRALSGRPGVLGVALSGAGPSVLVFLDPDARTDRTCRMVRAHLRANQLAAELIVTEISPRGAVCTAH